MFDLNLIIKNGEKEGGNGGRNTGCFGFMFIELVGKILVGLKKIFFKMIISV